jgi:hypothetical protein
MQPNRSSRPAPADDTARYRHPLGAALAIATAVLLAAACGSAAPTASTAASGPSPKTMIAAAFQYSRCMRAHGLPNFPDPHVSTGNGHQSIGVAVTPAQTSSPEFKAAQTACRGIMPMPSPTQVAQQQHAEEQGKLSFAECVRHHGITNFPDPNSQGQLTLQMVSAAGVDLHAPAVLAAAKACVGASHGTISAAAVQQAINSGQ